MLAAHPGVLRTMEIGMNKPEYNYLRIDFRITADTIDEAEIEKLVGFQEMNSMVATSHQTLSVGKAVEYWNTSKVEGPDKWNVVNQVLDWVKIKGEGFKKIRVDADVDLIIAIVCNIKGVKNPVPELTREKMSEISWIRVSVVAEANEKASARIN